MLYTGKTVIVTGAASGIGRSAALAFAREGANVTVADVNRQGGEAVVKEITAAGARAIFVETDVTSETAVAAMVAKTVAEFGGLDAAFNNAGAPGRNSTAVTCTREHMDETYRSNVISVWLCMKYEIPEMIKRGGGAIVNMSSRAGEDGVPNMISYVTSKHAVLGLTRSAALDFAAQNIRVNAVLPGMTDTPMVGQSSAEMGATFDQVVAQSTPLGRMARPEEIGDTAVWLCSERASYITGTTISADGGMSAHM